ncbi:hypothetical protein [Falsibacillus albus]|uniref:Uncharacterized protein n=1 Tax=Falsibacillus albus TaxID=2478915 RepID=A0A3L7JTN9_9BACI|nr:hypothetical protein [Falsibacillus albus]RLQ93439.1 hypothetical protein D9X91_17195 [Falsibacillus albus]
MLEADMTVFLGDWSSNDVIDARYGRILKKAVTNLRHWSPIWPYSEESGHQSAPLVPGMAVFRGKRSPICAIGARYGRIPRKVVTNLRHWSPT